MTLDFLYTLVDALDILISLLDEEVTTYKSFTQNTVCTRTDNYNSEPKLIKQHCLFT